MKTETNSKIIADTGIWIEFLRNNPDIFAFMKELLEKSCIFGIECIFGELLQGVKSDRESKIILGYWEFLPKVDESCVWIEAGNYSNKNKLSEKGVGLIDCVLIVLSLKNNLKIWTLDKKLKGIVKPGLIYLS